MTLEVLASIQSFNAHFSRKAPVRPSISAAALGRFVKRLGDSRKEALGRLVSLGADKVLVLGL
jgi:hypothetical protein